MTLERRNTIAFVCGLPGSGKSQLLHDVFSSRAARVLTLEFTRFEAAERDPDCIKVVGFPQLLAQLKAVAAFPSWHIAAALDEEHLPALFTLLTPPLSSGKGGYATAVGGMALECGECDIPWPIHPTPEASNLCKRGRHFGLSLFLGTQRPHECARIVTATAGHVICFTQTEPNDVEYLGKTLTKRIAALLHQLPKYWCLWYEKNASVVYLMDDARRVRKTIPTSSSDSLSLGSDK